MYVYHHIYHIYVYIYMPVCIYTLFSLFLCMARMFGFLHFVKGKEIVEHFKISSRYTVLVSIQSHMSLCAVLVCVFIMFFPREKELWKNRNLLLVYVSWSVPSIGKPSCFSMPDQKALLARISHLNLYPSGSLMFS